MRSFHPLIQRVIDEFGERGDVQSKLHANMHTFGWSGSVTTYYEMYLVPLEALQNHPKSEVRHWARRTLSQMQKNILRERDSDEEHNAHYE